MPERFGLEYVGSDGAIHRPVMIHRAAFGSIERFLGILIEHFAGAFPLWLAPVQMRVLSISDKAEAYARQVYDALCAAGLRAELDVRSEKIGYKIREAESLKINYMAVVGEREAAENKIALRAHGGKDLGKIGLADWIAQAMCDIEARR
jgi:threonyl-tRNA synthetase